MLEQVAWVERADVARLWPGRIRVVLLERTPVAFVRTSGGLSLVDSSGQLLDRPPQGEFSFPVVSGVSDGVAPEERRRRMALYSAVIQDLDREGTRYSQDLSEIEVGDPDDAHVVVTDTSIVLHLGSERFLERYKTYLEHIQEWRRSFPKIRSVDLRYERQVVVNPDTR
jgi:cell division protein FtsQ